jgi:sporulation protein YlmC with PRC-barrel domain
MAVTAGAEIMASNSDRIQHTDFSTPTRRVMSAASLASDSVRNKTGEKVGSITDIMIDLPSGRVAYAVLSFGGFLGFGEKLFAIPWEALTLDEDNKWFILDVDKGTLENAPGFDKDNWPDMADASWGTDIHNYYGQKPYWEKYPESYRMDSQWPAPSATDEIGKQASIEYDRNAKKVSQS